jgi:hypothetical protein
LKDAEGYEKDFRQVVKTVVARWPLKISNESRGKWITYAAYDAICRKSGGPHTSNTKRGKITYDWLPMLFV